MPYIAIRVADVWEWERERVTEDNEARYANIDLPAAHEPRGAGEIAEAVLERMRSWGCAFVGETHAPSGESLWTFLIDDQSLATRLAEHSAAADTFSVDNWNTDLTNPYPFHVPSPNH